MLNQAVRLVVGGQFLVFLRPLKWTEAGAKAAVQMEALCRSVGQGFVDKTTAAAHR